MQWNPLGKEFLASGVRLDIHSYSNSYFYSSKCSLFLSRCQSIASYLRKSFFFHQKSWVFFRCRPDKICMLVGWKCYYFRHVSSFQLIFAQTRALNSPINVWTDSFIVFWWLSDWTILDYGPWIWISIGLKCWNVVILFLICQFSNSQFSKATDLKSDVKVSVRNSFCLNYFIVKFIGCMLDRLFLSPFGGKFCIATAPLV